MGLFNKDLIEREIKVPLMDQFAYELMHELKQTQKSLIKSLFTHGQDSIKNSIIYMISRMRKSKKYNNLMVDIGDSQYGYSTNYHIRFIDEDLYISLDFNEIIYNRNENWGHATIILDRRFNVKKYTIKHYDE